MNLARGSRLDLISELPDGIIGSILQYLPIQDAVRTSLLSPKWRYNWVTLPSLTFDDRDLRFSSNYSAVDKVYKVLNFIDRVLLLHVGEITKFKLYISDYRANCSNIDQYILFLSKHGIREFILDIRCKYVVHSCLLSCQKLTYLELHNCTFECLSANKGFDVLKRLHLEKITFRDDDQFESLISCSPLLEILILSDFDNVTHLKIDAPNLKSFVFSGSFDSICFVNTPHLASVLIGLDRIHDDAIVLEQGVSCHLIKVLGGMHNIEKLCIARDFIDYLAMGNVPESLPTTCHHLKILKIELCFNELDKISATLCLIRSAPNLEELEITGDSWDTYTVSESILKFLEMQNDLNFSLNQLRVVKMKYVAGLRSELGFIKLILSSSPVLKTMSIVAIKAEPTFAQELFQLRRTSARAEILFEKYHLIGTED